MSSYCGTANTGFNFGGFFKFCLILLLLFSIAMIVIGSSVDHGLAKHKSDSVLADSCLDGNTPALYKIVVVKPDNNNRKVELCMIEDGIGGFMGMAIRVSEKINGQVHKITSYVDRNYTTLNSMIDYAECEASNWGYFDYVSTLVKALFIQ